MSSTIHESLYTPITVQRDIEARIFGVEIPGSLEASGRPIKNGATGEAHRVWIDVPGGIESDRAEIGSAYNSAAGAITLDIKDSYGQFNIERHGCARPLR
jgi:hypothetical protein